MIMELQIVPLLASDIPNYRRCHISQKSVLNRERIMNKAKAESNNSYDLRRQAEERLKDSQSGPFGSDTANDIDTMALFHELEVHQINLEMQNEELKRAKLETENALTKYSDLYDFGPIGLFAFDAQGLIQEVNLAGAALLGVERRNLITRRFQAVCSAQGPFLF